MQEWLILYDRSNDIIEETTVETPLLYNQILNSIQFEYGKIPDIMLIKCNTPNSNLVVNFSENSNITKS